MILFLKRLKYDITIGFINLTIKITEWVKFHLEYNKLKYWTSPRYKFHKLLYRKLYLLKKKKAIKLYPNKKIELKDGGRLNGIFCGPTVPKHKVEKEWLRILAMANAEEKEIQEAIRENQEAIRKNNEQFR